MEETRGGGIKRETKVRDAMKNTGRDESSSKGASRAPGLPSRRRVGPSRLFRKKPARIKRQGDALRCAKKDRQGGEAKCERRRRPTDWGRSY